MSAAKPIKIMYGTVVYYDEYRDLQAALREALDGWENFGRIAAMTPDWSGWKRIAELRKEFLE